MDITSKPSTKKNTSRKKTVSKINDIHSESFVCPYVEYRHMITREIIGVDRKKACELANKLIRYTDSHEILRIESFHLKEGISAESWKTLCDSFEELRDALIIAKNTIGDFRLKLGLEKKYDANLASYALHQYHPDWKAAEDYHDIRKTKIAAASDGNQGNAQIHVHMDAIPNSNIVPEKIKDKE